MHAITITMEVKTYAKEIVDLGVGSPELAWPDAGTHSTAAGSACATARGSYLAGGA
jgi:hypothetical protein